MWYSFLQNYNFSAYTKTSIIASTQIGHEHYTYDANGNPTLVENDSLNTERRMYWDEDNRLMVLSDNGKTSRYTYNATGERIIKSHGNLEGVYVNGAPQGIALWLSPTSDYASAKQASLRCIRLALKFHETEDYTIYPAPIITVTKNHFTKHYFIGDKRVASKLGIGKFSNVYGISGNNVTAGQKDYAARMMQIEKQRGEYYKSLGTPPGVPTMKGATADPDNTGRGYNDIIGDLGDHSVPEGWVQQPKFNDKGDAPGPPIQWQKPEDPDNAQPGYGYVSTDTTNIEEIFFYHFDHLGSTSYITDAKANITQFDAYLPYGELLEDEHCSSEDMPYKFNGKELDQETGLYYYGARYMNPVISIWYGVDALTEKYPTIGGYVYCAGNPIKLVDLDGRKVIPILYLNNSKYPSSYYHSPKNFQKAMIMFAQSSFGKNILADFTPKGQSIFGVNGNGKYAKFNLILQEELISNQQTRTSKFFKTKERIWIHGQTFMDADADGNPQFTVVFDLDYSTAELTETISHEFAVHLTKASEVIEAYLETGNMEKSNEIWSESSASKEHHNLTEKDKNKQLQSTKNYNKTRNELVKKYPSLNNIFNEAKKEHTKY